MRTIFLWLALLLAAPAPAQMMVSPLTQPSVADTLQYAVPTTGQTVAIQPGISALILNNAGVLATLTITLPDNPSDGQRIVITGGGALITFMTINVGAGGGTIKGTVATLALNGYARFMYSAAANAWFRTG